MSFQGWKTQILLVASCLLFTSCQSAPLRLFTGPDPEPFAEYDLPQHSGKRPNTKLVSAEQPVESLPQLQAPAEQLPAELPEPAEPNSKSKPAEPNAEPETVQAPPAEPQGDNGTLELQEVILSVEQKYPLLLSAFMERQVAEGKQLNAAGAFDLNIKAYGIAAPEGFYKTYRNGISLEQPLYHGGYAYGGYRIGDGNFQPWYGERETNEGGEFKAIFGTPLVKDRGIDKRREELFKANLSRRAVEPAAMGQFIEFARMASYTYWAWVAAGRTLAAERSLLKIAQERVNQINERVNAGDLPQISRINNEQLIAKRETLVIKAERKLQEAGIKLSMFLRDDAGNPIIPAESQLPDSFPTPAGPDPDEIGADIARAIVARPELAELNIEAEKVRVEMAQAENLQLPKVDFQVIASKDVGAAASSKGDKTPFELEAGLYGEMPLQRREGRGKMISAQGKLSQIEAKRQFVINKVTTMVQDAMSALQTSAARIEQAETNLRLAEETVTLGRERFNAGDLDLVELNIYELAANDAQIILIEAHADFLIALANYQAALSVNPSNAAK